MLSDSGRIGGVNERDQRPLAPNHANAIGGRAAMAESEITRRCCQCGATRPLSHFTKDTRKPDGHAGLCLPCKRVIDRERIRRRYATDEVFRRKKIAVASRHIQKPEQRRARLLAQNARRTGLLVRPDTCERCDLVGVPLHGHHDDYSKPLEVKWLCRTCHGRQHRGSEP